MNNQKYIVNIHKPCQQNWSLMQRLEGGRFCEFCQHKVIDFTLLNDLEIESIVENTNGKLCGRFSLEQIKERSKQRIEPKLNPFWPKLAAGLVLFSTATNIVAQSKSDSLSIAKTKIEKNTAITNLPSVNPYIIRGKVVDDITKEALIGAAILIKGTNTGITADFDGNYELKIPAHLQKEKIEIEVKYVAYETNSFVVDKSSLPLEHNISLKSLEQTDAWANVVVGEVTYEKAPKRKWWNRKYRKTK